MDDWKQLETRTLKENVTNLLRQAIIDGSLGAGEELNQAQIAERLGISRGPVREALGQLEQEGLIRNVPYKGVIVTSLTPTYVKELYSLRGALETFAVRLGIEHDDPDDVAELRAIVDEMRAAAGARDELELARIDLKFHTALIAMARHELLAKTWGPLKIGVQRCLRTRHRIYASLDEVVGSHPALIDAIERRDVDGVTELLRDHIEEAGDHLVEAWLRENVETGDA